MRSSVNNPPMKGNARKALLMAALLIGSWSCSMPSAVAPSIRGSVGVPHAGFLTDGKQLPKKGKGFQWRSNADHHYALPRMVALLEEAAAKVSEETASTMPLFVGELSAKNGGPLFPKHRSHRTGRDADILFYMTSVEGVPLAGNTFTVFGSDGIGVAPDGQFVRFDVHRNWLFLRSILSSEKANIQWIFVSNTLKALLIEHAIALGDPSKIIQRAETLLMQPGDSAPHDDHFHVRIACNADEYAKGCQGGGPRWPWLPTPKPIHLAHDSAIQALLNDEPNSQGHE